MSGHILELSSNVETLISPLRASQEDFQEICPHRIFL